MDENFQYLAEDINLYPKEDKLKEIHAKTCYSQTPKK